MPRRQKIPDAPRPTYAIRPDLDSRTVDVVTNQSIVPEHGGLGETLRRFIAVNAEYTGKSRLSGYDGFLTKVSDAMRPAKGDTRLSDFKYIMEDNEPIQAARRINEAWWSPISLQNPTEVCFTSEAAEELAARTATAVSPQSPISGPAAHTQTIVTEDAGHTIGASWRRCPLKAVDALTTEDLRATKLPKAKHKVLFYQHPVTGIVEGRSNMAVDPPLFQSFIDSCATTNHPDTTPTDRKRRFLQSVPRSHSRMPSRAWGCQQVEDSADWDTIKQKDPEYFPLLTGPNLITANFKRKMVYEGDPPILSIFVHTEKDKGLGDPNKEYQLEALSSVDVPEGSAMDELLQAITQLNEQKNVNGNVEDELLEIVERATMADDSSVNGAKILLEQNPHQQHLRHCSDGFFNAVSYGNPHVVSLTKSQAASLKSNYSSIAASTS